MQLDGLLMRTVGFEARVEVGTSTHPEVVADADLVLVCVKTVDTVAVTKSIAAAVEAPGEVRHRGRGDLIVGHHDPARRPDVDRQARWFTTAEVRCSVTENVERELCFKLIVNSLANAISAIGNVTYGQLAEFAPTWELARRVARADGDDHDYDDVVRRGLEVARSVAAATSSTQQDLLKGRPTEIDALNGYIARRGAVLGVDAPVNLALWALVKILEQPGAQASARTARD
jgi:2-dehydropantoate 2-reductase